MTEQSPASSSGTSAEKKKRNWAVLIGLVVFVALIYGITIVKISHLGGGS